MLNRLEYVDSQFDQPSYRNVRMGNIASGHLLFLALHFTGVVKQGRLGREYRYELSLVLNGTAPIPDLGKMERLVAAQFRGPCLPRGTVRITTLKYMYLFL